MVVTLTIETDTLKYYIQKSQLDLAYLQKKISNFDKFMSGEKQPTFNQLSEIAKKLNVPTGLLLLKNKVDMDSKRLDFRTLNSDHIEKMSPELRDTINEMEAKQDFLREEIDNTVNFIGTFNIDSNIDEIVYKIRKDLDIEIFWQKKSGSSPLNYLRKKISDLGVYIFFNGKVKDNTHRPLSVNEFRGFVLKDDKAPIIFINQRDFKNGQLFTLVHELVHLYVGTEEIFNIVDTGFFTYDRTEAFVNKVTAELLVPKSELLNELDKDLEDLSRMFKVSKFVILRRLLDIGKIDKKEYSEAIAQLEEELKRIPIKSSGSGNYNNNLKFRVDGKFVSLVENAVVRNKISYTDAFNIVGVGIKGYKTLTEGGN
ncbi:ImmA/IrrE family metallo-endopeptidase [Lactococcus petauri]|uniref:ImmA/IrrE family metallo-endopeptidase n=1 Tax=Lactococcus petauri TaxID=1940789 RepID=UPI0034D64609